MALNIAGDFNGDGFNDVLVMDIAEDLQSVNYYLIYGNTSLKREEQHININVDVDNLRLGPANSPLGLVLSANDATSWLTTPMRSTISPAGKILKTVVCLFVFLFYVLIFSGLILIAKMLSFLRLLPSHSIPAVYTPINKKNTKHIKIQ